MKERKRAESGGFDINEIGLRIGELTSRLDSSFDAIEQAFTEDADDVTRIEGLTDSIRGRIKDLNDLSGRLKMELKRSDSEVVRDEYMRTSIAVVGFVAKLEEFIVGWDARENITYSQRHTIFDEVSEYDIPENPSLHEGTRWIMEVEELQRNGSFEGSIDRWKLALVADWETTKFRPAERHATEREAVAMLADDIEAAYDEGRMNPKVMREEAAKILATYWNLATEITTGEKHGQAVEDLKRVLEYVIDSWKSRGQPMVANMYHGIHKDIEALVDRSYTIRTIEQSDEIGYQA